MTAESIAMSSTALATISEMVQHAGWLDADGCAFLLGMRNRKGEVNRRGFLERVAVKSSFPKPHVIAGTKRWRRDDVARWAEDEARMRTIP